MYESHALKPDLLLLPVKFPDPNLIPSRRQALDQVSVHFARSVTHNNLIGKADARKLEISHPALVLRSIAATAKPVAKQFLAVERHNKGPKRKLQKFTEDPLATVSFAHANMPLLVMDAPC
jgi:hypothetical protein